MNISNRICGDINILTYGASTERNCKILEEMHVKCQKWASKHGALFALDKYEVIHLTRALKYFNLKVMLNLEGLQMQMKTNI